MRFYQSVLGSGLEKQAFCKAQLVHAHLKKDSKIRATLKKTADLGCERV